MYQIRDLRCDIAQEYIYISPAHSLANLLPTTISIDVAKLAGLSTTSSLIFFPLYDGPNLLYIHLSLNNHIFIVRLYIYFLQRVAVSLRVVSIDFAVRRFWARYKYCIEKKGS